MAAETQNLPEECWELIFNFLDHCPHFESVSLVCRQFLSITNSLQFSLTISDPAIPLLPQLLVRFRRLKSIDLSHFHGDLEPILHQISRPGLDLDSLNLSNQRTLPVNGLRELGSKLRTLRVLTCSKIGSLHNSDLLVIADCFPLLQELDISFPDDAPSYSIIDFNNSNNYDGPVSNFGIMALSSVLKNLRKINLSGNYFITGISLLNLCKNCELLQEIVIIDCDFITEAHIASAFRERPTLTSISISNVGNGSAGRFSLGTPLISLDFICSLMSLKSLTAIDLSNSSISDELLCSVAEGGLPLKKLILQNCRNYTYAGIFSLFSKCQSIQYLDLLRADFLSDERIKELSMFLGNLTSINLGGCGLLTNSTFFTLARNCPVLNDIKMERTSLGVDGVEDPLMDFVVNSRVKALHLAQNHRLRDESIKRFASICPNLQVLDLSSCWGISEEGVVEVLKRCCEIRHLSLAFCGRLRLFKIDFDVYKLEVLNMSSSKIDDEALLMISKRCRGLLLLDMQNCLHVTAKGVKQVVGNCRGLREINLKCCNRTDADIVAWMVFSRPSLRKITAPPGFVRSESQRELFLRHGCLVC